mmetsp:Transcript_16557/g.33767  ORF Transcript_16557/g.33767 Transcript_16557/m.33767 type:complete len:906 (+) Transcript_16557:109-2826(+)
MPSLFSQRRVPDLVKNGQNALINGNNDDALNYFKKALKRERHLNGDGSILAARILHNIGLVLASNGESLAAMNSFEEALHIRQDKLGPGSEESAETTAQMIKLLDEIRIQSGIGERKFVKGNNGTLVDIDVGTNLLEWGEYDEAERVLSECLDFVTSNKEATDDEILKAQSAMAALFRAQGKYKEAKQLYLEAMKVARKIESRALSNGIPPVFKELNTSTSSDKPLEIDISIINSIAGYAEILRKGGELWQAKDLHKKVRKILLSAKSKRLNIRCGNTIGIYSTDYVNESKSDRVVEESEIDLHLAISHTQLGCTFFALKKYNDAFLEHQAALDIRLHSLEFTDAPISESFNYCAETLCSMENNSDALPLSLHAVHVRKLEFGIRHPAFAHALSVLSKCYQGIHRSSEAFECIQWCLDICEAIFSANHANLIPNVLAKGDILHSLGYFEKAAECYRKAKDIHTTNFITGQNDLQLEEIQKKLTHATMATSNKGCSSTLNEQPYQRWKKKDGGDPVIIITDIGRDIDDAIAFMELASLERMCILNPLGVIATVAPELERAYLARVTLDSLGLSDVPVGVGSDGGGSAEVKLNSLSFLYDGEKKLLRFEPGIDLMKHILMEVEDPKSVKLVCLSSLKDVSNFMKQESDLFCSKIREVLIMGSAEYSEEKQRIMPFSGYNTNLDWESANFVYRECQERSIPTSTVTRHAAHGCPFPPSFMKMLQDTHHLLAIEVRSVHVTEMDKLWAKLKSHRDTPERQGLTPTNDCESFLNFFRLQVCDSCNQWKNSSSYIYGSLVFLHCVDAYREMHFSPKCHLVKGVLHRVTGEPTAEDGSDRSGIANREKLRVEIQRMIQQGLSLSLTASFGDAYGRKGSHTKSLSNIVEMKTKGNQIDGSNVYSNNNDAKAMK